MMMMSRRCAVGNESELLLRPRHTCCGAPPKSPSFLGSAWDPRRGTGGVGRLTLLEGLQQTAQLSWTWLFQGRPQAVVVALVVLLPLLLLLLMLAASLPCYSPCVPRGRGYRRNEDRQGKREGARPWMVPLLGALPDYLLHFSTLYDHITDILGRNESMTFTTFLPGQTDVVTANPENIKHILKDNFSNYPKGPHFQEIFRDFLGHGIFNSDGKDWQRQRKAASVVFTTNSLRSVMLSTVQEGLRERLIPTLEAAASSSSPVDLQDVLLRYTFSNICRIGFGVDPGCLSSSGSLPPSPFASAFDQATRVTMLRNLFPSWAWRLGRWLNVGPERRLREAVAEVKAFVKGVVDRRREEVVSMGMQGPIRGDLLSRILYLQEDQARHSEEFLIEACTNFVLAGRDTSAVVLSWLFWLLTQHQGVEERMLAEMQRVKMQRKDRCCEDPFTYDELKSLHYVHAVINEALRLYPPVPVGSKYAMEEDVLPDGTYVGKGWRVLYIMYATGRMPQVWGSDALEFKPERWLNANACIQTETQFKFPAFNGGPRLCLGKDMAYLQMVSALAEILPKFSCTMGDVKSLSYQISLTLFVKGGLLMNISRRNALS